MTERKDDWTPGPWHPINNGSFWDIIPENGGENGPPYGIGDVCASEPSNPNGGLQEANARLIAASPEMVPFVEREAERGDPDAIALLARIRGERA